MLQSNRSTNRLHLQPKRGKQAIRRSILPREKFVYILPGDPMNYENWSSFLLVFRTDIVERTLLLEVCEVGNPEISHHPEGNRLVDHLVGIHVYKVFACDVDIRTGEICLAVNRTVSCFWGNVNHVSTTLKATRECNCQTHEQQKRHCDCKAHRTRLPYRQPCMSVTIQTACESLC